MVDEINVNPEEQVEDQDHVQEMVDKVDNQDVTVEAEETETPEELLAGKYKSEDDLAKGILEVMKAQGKNPEDFYKELESGLGQQQPQQEEDTTESEEVVEETDEELEETDTDLDLKKYETEFMANGNLSEASYEELQAKGIPKEVVDGYIQSQQAAAESQVQEVYSIAGGQEGYSEMISWAQDNLSESEIQNFNETINAGVGQAKFAVEALYNRFTDANGTPPKQLVSGNSPSNGTSDVYSSRAEVTEDMRNPKYKKDPAFRKKVQAKLSRSNVL